MNHYITSADSIQAAQHNYQILLQKDEICAHFLALYTFNSLFEKIECSEKLHTNLPNYSTVNTLQQKAFHPKLSNLDCSFSYSEDVPTITIDSRFINAFPTIQEESESEMREFQPIMNIESSGDFAPCSSEFGLKLSMFVEDENEFIGLFSQQQEKILRPNVKRIDSGLASYQ